ncbi:MAG: HEPN domain-containing protein [Armatimonadota bacterium]
MTCEREARHRLDIACRLMGEAEQDAELGRWRSSAANGQQALEHASKAVLACYGPVPRTHYVHVNLQNIVRTSTAGPDNAERIQRLSAIATGYGREQHMRVTYGDEDELVSPYDLIDEAEGRQSAADAREACELAHRIVDSRFP